MTWRCERKFNEKILCKCSKSAKSMERNLFLKWEVGYKERPELKSNDKSMEIRHHQMPNVLFLLDENENLRRRCQAGLTGWYYVEWYRILLASKQGGMKWIHFTTHPHAWGSLLAAGGWRQFSGGGWISTIKEAINLFVARLWFPFSFPPTFTTHCGHASIANLPRDWSLSGDRVRTCSTLFETARHESDCHMSEPKNHICVWWIKTRISGENSDHDVGCHQWMGLWSLERSIGGEVNYYYRRVDRECWCDR